MNKPKYIFFIILLLGVLLSKAVVFEFYRVTSASMSETILPGDFLLINRLVFGTHTPNRITIPFVNKSFSIPSAKIPPLRQIRQNDIVVIKNSSYSRGENNLVKRVAAVEDQSIMIIDDYVFVDGDLFNPDEKANELVIPEGYMYDNFIVPEGKIYVLGDNSTASFDSRDFGFVDKNDVLGKAVIIYASIDIDGNFRWKRFFDYLE